jgi:hypothetical protein
MSSLFASKEPRECPLCKTPIHRSWALNGDCPMFLRHVERCRQATPAQRDFYREHRRWPLNAQPGPVVRPKRRPARRSRAWLALASEVRDALKPMEGD